MLAELHPSAERRHRHAPATVVGTLHTAGCALFALAMTQSGPHALTMAVALTAYLLGVRHAFDVDHIVAIDNTTRYLRRLDRHAGSVGFWFSLGHSSVVLLACVLLGLGWHSLASASSAPAATVASTWGPAVSGSFLMVLAVVNARILADLWRQRHASTADGLAARGFVTGLIGRHWSIRRPSQMLIVGFLFGLGFDTATSVGLLLLSAGADQAILPWSAFVALPLLFAAGMTLFDSLDAVAMNRAYGWADAESRRIRYNLAVTAVSVVAAAAIGALTLVQLLGGPI